MKLEKLQGKVYILEPTPKMGIASMAIDNHMAIILGRVGKNTIEDILLDEGFKCQHYYETIMYHVWFTQTKTYSIQFVDGRSNHY
jgi:arginine/ornithine N-succinyltransferase beta subunit